MRNYKQITNGNSAREFLCDTFLSVQESINKLRVGLVNPTYSLFIVIADLIRNRKVKQVLHTKTMRYRIECGMTVNVILDCFAYARNDDFSSKLLNFSTTQLQNHAVPHRVHSNFSRWGLLTQPTIPKKEKL